MIKKRVPTLGARITNLAKFSSTLHLLQESYKFVQESQTLQTCYNVEHFLQDSNNIFAKNTFFLVRSSYKKCDV